MTAHMGRDVLHLHSADVVVPLHSVVETVLPVHGHILCDWEFPCSGVGLCGLDDILHLGCPQKLMVDGDDVVLQVNVLDGKSIKFRNLHSRMEQNVERLVVFAVHIIVPDKLEVLPHLVFRDSFPCDGVVHNHSGKFKAEGVLN